MFNKFTLNSADLEAALVTDAFLSSLPRMGGAMYRNGEQVVIDGKFKKRHYANVSDYVVRIANSVQKNVGGKVSSVIEYDYFVMTNSTFRNLFTEIPTIDEPPVKNPRQRRQKIIEKNLSAKTAEELEIEDFPEVDVPKEESADEDFEE